MDATTGTVGCTVSLGIDGTGSETYTIGVVVGGHYTRNKADDNTTVTVAQPIHGMIAGGGHFVARASAGAYARGGGSKTNFGFNVRFNKRLTNLQGNVNIIVRTGDGGVYQIKANAMSSLATDIESGTASFASKANHTDIADPANPVSLGGNLDLQMTITDTGDAGASDAIGITLRDSAGALLFSSRWSGTRTTEQDLNGGNLVVR